MQKGISLITILWILSQSSFAKRGLKSRRPKYPCALCKYDIGSRTSSNVITTTTDKGKQEGDYKSYTGQRQQGKTLPLMHSQNRNALRYTIAYGLIGQLQDSCQRW